MVGFQNQCALRQLVASSVQRTWAVVVGGMLMVGSGLAAPAWAAPLNSIETIVEDMRQMNDLPLAGAPPGPGWQTGPGHVVMGNDPRGTRTPDWWSPANPRYKSADYWTVLLPWLVVYDGVGNTAVNTRVQLRNLRVYVQSRATGRWLQRAAAHGVEGAIYPKHLQGEVTVRPDERREADGSTSILPPRAAGVYHGWCCGPIRIDGPDVAAVFVTVQARLVPDRPTAGDDRAAARYLLQVGADYYPDAKTRISAFTPANFNPGVGLSRFKRVTSAWQAFNFATLDVGVQSPGGAAISVSSFRAAPPPLE